MYNQVFDPTLYAVWIVFVFIIGAVIGSFLNVVIYRVPNEQSVVFPSSSCPKCNTPLKFYDNIPIISYLVLQGKCRFCKAGISFQYPLVEFLNASLYTLLFFHHDLLFSWSLLFDCIFVSAVLALIFIDYFHMILPNVITYPFFILALLIRIFVPNTFGVEFLAIYFLPAMPISLLSLLGAVLGALVGGGSLWLTGFIWEKARGVEAMGLGDVKMMLMLGAYLGAPLTVLNIFFGVFAGSIAGVLIMLLKGEKDLKMLLPFGVFLGIGFVFTLLFGVQTVNWYVNSFLR